MMYVDKESHWTYYAVPVRQFFSRELTDDREIAEAVDEFNAQVKIFREWLETTYEGVENTRHAPPQFIQERADAIKKQKDTIRSKAKARSKTGQKKVAAAKVGPVSEEPAGGEGGAAA